MQLTNSLYNNIKECKYLPSPAQTPTVAKRVSELVNLLNEPKIDKKKLAKIMSSGVPEQAVKLHEYCWKIMLNYLPPDKSMWQTKIQQQQKSYNQFIRQFLPSQKYPDYPYIMNKKHERWSQLSQDFLLWQQIQKDTTRTYSELAFFSMEAPPIMIPFFTNVRKQKFKCFHTQDPEIYKNFLNNKEMQRKTYRYDNMSRILYIFAKLNPKIKYIQGMNQILAPIFYIVNANRPNGSPIEQASCFFMFNSAIIDVMQLHMRDLDKSKHGIHWTLNQINQMLLVIEKDVWLKLQQLKIDPLFYSFRWVTLLFTQDFQLLQILRIWDSIFTSQNKVKFMCFLALSILLSVKQFILDQKNDFSKILSFLQEVGTKVDVDKIIEDANTLYDQYKNYNFQEQSKLIKQQLQKQKLKQNNNNNNSIFNLNTFTSFFKNLIQ